MFVDKLRYRALTDKTPSTAAGDTGLAGSVCQSKNVDEFEKICYFENISPPRQSVCYCSVEPDQAEICVFFTARTGCQAGPPRYCLC